MAKVTRFTIADAIRMAGVDSLDPKGQKLRITYQWHGVTLETWQLTKNRAFICGTCGCGAFVVELMTRDGSLRCLKCAKPVSSWADDEPAGTDKRQPIKRSKNGAKKRKAAA